MLKQAAYFLASIIVLMMIFVAVERSSSPFFQSCIDYQQGPKAQAASKEQPSGNGAVLTAYVACSGRFIEGHGVGITALATIIIAAFTCTLWLATSNQAELTRQAFIADKRAFVFAKGFNALYEPGANNTWNWRFSPIWENSGDTQTVGCQFSADGVLMTAHMSPGFDLSYIDPQRPPGAGMLGPHSMSPAGMVPQFGRAAITPQDILDIQAGNKFLYFWGFARYRDTLPGTKEHITRFCWMMLPNGDPTTFNPAVDHNSVTWTNVHQARGNCADEECVLQGLS